MMNHNLLFSLLLINAQLIVGQGKNIYEYLPKNTEYLIYHDDWGKNNYKKLLNQFNSDPLNPLTQHVKYGGFVDNIQDFDPAFFGITPREAKCMDPQQRMLLEVSWRTIENAGYPSESLKGKSVGVYVGISSSDYSSLLWISNEDYLTPNNEPFILSGNTGCIAANRISYFFDFRI